MKLIPVVFVVLACAALNLEAQNLVYGVPQTARYFQISEGVEYADGAQLGGTDRFVTDASLRVYSNVESTGDVIFSLYEAVPVTPPVEGGQPGILPGPLEDFRPADTPLWSSGAQSVTFTAGARNTTELVFSGINTLVPDDLFWAIEFNNVSGIAGSGLFGPLLGDAGNLEVDGSATDPSRFYSRLDGAVPDSWQVTHLSGGSSSCATSTLSVEINAVPEPGIAFLSVLGVMGLLRRRRTA